MQKLTNLATFLGACVILLSPQISTAKSVSPAAQIEAQLGTTILEAKPAALEAAVTHAVQQNPDRCHTFAPAILKGGRADANQIAPYLVVATLKALGKDLTERKLTAIIYESVIATPDAALEIVAAASRNVPEEWGSVVANAAVRAVPDPSKLVQVVTKTLPVELSGENGLRDYKSINTGDYKNVTADYKAGPEPYNQELADAILDNSLNSLMSSTHDPRAISAVGNAGSSNYGNEPRISTLISPPKTPVVSK